MQEHAVIAVTRSTLRLQQKPHAGFAVYLSVATGQAGNHYVCCSSCSIKDMLTLPEQQNRVHPT